MRINKKKTSYSYYLRGLPASFKERAVQWQCSDGGVVVLAGNAHSYVAVTSNAECNTTFVGLSCFLGLVQRRVKKEW